ncbi:MAG: MATE family efflux transporter [Pseudomonadota bacterium]
MTGAVDAADISRPITHRRVLLVALPIVLSNATVPLMGVVDTFAVGQLGRAEPIGAVALGATILTSVYWIFGFLRMGTAGMVAQAHGAGNRAEVSALLTRALVISLGAGAVFIAAQALLIAAALSLSRGSAEVESLAAQYLTIRIWGAPAAIAVYALTGWLVALERTGGVFALQLVMNGGNIVLSLTFVLGLGWGVPGVAAATLLAEFGGAAVGLWLCRDAFARPAWRDWPAVFDRVRLAEFGSVNRDIMIRSVLLTLCFASVTFSGTALGDTTLAANQILIQFVYVSAYALDGFAFAAEAMVGSAMGARNPAVLRRAALMTSFWAILVTALVTLAYLVFGEALIRGMTTAVDVQEEALRYLPWAIAAPLIGAPAFMLDGIFIGATRARDMRNMMILSALGYAAAMAVAVPAYGNHGLWLALTIFFVLRGVTLGWRYPALEAAAR